MIQSHDRTNSTATSRTEHTSVINPKLVLQTLARWWHIVVPLGLVLATTAGVLIYLTYVPEYEAKVVLRIQAPPKFFGRQSDNKQYVDNQVAFLRSELVLEQVLDTIDRTEVKELAKERDPISEMKDRVTVNPLVASSDYYEVTYRSYSPQHAADIANAIAEAYRRLNSDWDAEERREKILRYEALKKKKNDELVQLLGRLQRTRLDYLQPGQDSESLSGLAIPPKLAGLSVELDQLRSQITTLEIERNVKKKWVEEDRIEIPQDDLEAAIDRSPQVAGVVAALAANEQLISELEKQIESIRSRVKSPESMPLFKERQQQLAELNKENKQLQAALEEKRKMVRERAAESLRRFEKERLASLVEQYDLQIEMLQQQVEKKQAEFDAEFAKVRAEGGEARAQWMTLTMRLQSAQMLVDSFDKTIEELRMQGNVQTAEVFQAAKPPIEPVALVPWKKMFAGGGAVFLIPFGLALLWEIRVRRISDSQSLEDSAHLPIIGEVAALPVRRVGSSTKRISHGTWMFEESIESLRTSLMVDERLRDAKVFAVTSAKSQEGKTSVAAQLAVSIARSTGKRTVIVDGDMRSPDLHNIFDISVDDAGLAEVLADECSLADAIATTRTAHLDVLPAGQLRCTPHSLVGNGHFKGFLNELKKEYDYIVLDTPPLLAAAESVVMAKHADASLLCAMRDTSRLDQVRKAYQRLDQASANPIGVVLSGVPVRHYAYRYGDYAYTKKG